MTVSELVSAVLLVGGTAFMVLGALGLLRLPDVYTRAQAATKAATLGLALVFVAVAFEFRDLASISQALAVIAFAFLSIPVGAHAITRAAHRAGTVPWPADGVDDLRADQRARDAQPPAP